MVVTSRRGLQGWCVFFPLAGKLRIAFEALHNLFFRQYDFLFSSAAIAIVIFLVSRRVDLRQVVPVRADNAVTNQVSHLLLTTFYRACKLLLTRLTSRAVDNARSSCGCCTPTSPPRGRRLQDHVRQESRAAGGDHRHVIGKSGAGLS